MTLNDIKIHETAVVVSLNCNKILKLRLLDMGLTPNTLVKVQKIAPLGDPIQIQVRDYELTIRKNDAKKIYVNRKVL